VSLPGESLLPDIPLVAVVAIARNGVIGRDNKLLWRLKDDLRRFRALTIGKPVIMGRKTFLSIGRPLPNRHNIVVTRDVNFHAEGVETTLSIDAGLSAARRAAKAMDANEIIIGGGGEIYAALLGQCALAHVTLVDCAPEGDAAFPWPLTSDWRETARENHSSDADNEFDYSFLRFEQRK
jgi:dihydrofolate reductase